MANNLGLDPFPDPVGHFGAPWQPFWIFEVLLEGMMESKNLFSESFFFAYLIYISTLMHKVIYYYCSGMWVHDVVVLGLSHGGLLLFSGGVQVEVFLF